MNAIQERCTNIVSRPGEGRRKINGSVVLLQTMKKKLFVLREASAEDMAQLEYYDSEKKYNMGMPPKRAIQLKSCFRFVRNILPWSVRLMYLM